MRVAGKDDSGNCDVPGFECCQPIREFRCVVDHPACLGSEKLRIVTPILLLTLDALHKAAEDWLSYGSRRLARELRARGLKVNRKRL